ncbi:MAG TPA: flavin reductase, partial [Thermoanaerobaculia bacterium]|nr:flavin reductase [Thermoanaerobaculia bacterium]
MKSKVERLPDPPPPMPPPLVGGGYGHEGNGHGANGNGAANGGANGGGVVEAVMAEPALAIVEPTLAVVAPQVALPVAPEDFRAALRHFPSGVTIVTIRAGAEVHGLTVSAFASVSPVPPLIVVAIDH